MLTDFGSVGFSSATASGNHVTDGTIDNAAWSHDAITMAARGGYSTSRWRCPRPSPAGPRSPSLGSTPRGQVPRGPGPSPAKGSGGVPAASWSAMECESACLLERINLNGVPVDVAVSNPWTRSRARASVLRQSGSRVLTPRTATPAACPISGIRRSRRARRVKRPRCCRWPVCVHYVCNLPEPGSEVGVGQPSARQRLLSTPSPQPGKRRAAELKPEGWLLLWARAP